MKLSEYIEKLQELQEKYNGDLEIIYASDDEGNYFNKIHYSPTICIYNDGDDVMFFSDFEDEYKEDFAPNAICVN